MRDWRYLRHEKNCSKPLVQSSGSEVGECGLGIRIWDSGLGTRLAAGVGEVSRLPRQSLNILVTMGPYGRSYAIGIQGFDHVSANGAFLIVQNRVGFCLIVRICGTSCTRVIQSPEVGEDVIALGSGNGLEDSLRPLSRFRNQEVNSMIIAALTGKLNSGRVANVMAV